MIRFLIYLTYSRCLKKNLIGSIRYTCCCCSFCWWMIFLIAARWGVLCYITQLAGLAKANGRTIFSCLFFCFFEFYYFSTCCQRFCFTVFVCVNKPDRVVKWHFFNFSVTDTFFFRNDKTTASTIRREYESLPAQKGFFLFLRKKWNVCVNLNSKLRFIIIFRFILQNSNDSMKKNLHEHEEKHCGKIISHFYF